MGYIYIYISACYYCYNGDVMDYIYPKTANFVLGCSPFWESQSLGYNQFVGKTQIGICVYYIYIYIILVYEGDYMISCPFPTSSQSPWNHPGNSSICWWNHRDPDGWKSAQQASVSWNSRLEVRAYARGKVALDGTLKSGQGVQVGVSRGKDIFDWWMFWLWRYTANKQFSPDDAQDGYVEFPWSSWSCQGSPGHRVTHWEPGGMKGGPLWAIPRFFQEPLHWPQWLSGENRNHRGSPGSCGCFWMFMEHQNYPINQKDQWIVIVPWYSMSVDG